MYLYAQLAEMYNYSMTTCSMLDTYFNVGSNYSADILQRIDSFDDMIESTIGYMEIVNQYGLDEKLLNNRTSKFNEKLEDAIGAEPFYKDRILLICIGGFRDDFYSHISNLRAMSDALKNMYNIPSSIHSTENINAFYNYSGIVKNLSLYSTNCFNSIRAISDLI